MAAPYPQGPASVPAGLADAPSGYKTRAYLAVAALLGFVVLYVALTGWFAYKGFTLLRDSLAGGNHAFAGAAAGLLCAFLAIFLGKALFFIRRGANDDLIEVGADEPALLEFVHRIADETGAPRPHKVFLSPRVDAAVFYDLSLFNLLVPSRKNLVIGLGLVNVLTLSELKAVLGHEFGHFAQRSMAVGRWIYTGQQVAAHIVGKRDVLDRMLLGLSNIDIRVAWIGWIVRIIVWSVRSVMDQVFRMVIVAERALSRQMEYQADLVAVTISGSDALVHALHKLPAADEAWDRAANIAVGELQQGRIVPDLFEMQTRVLEHYKTTLGEDSAAEVPPLPEHGREQHRIFEAGLGQPPAMWSTHPASHLREDNAKRTYVPAPLDDRSAWLLFADAPAMRARATEHLLEPEAEALRLDRETALAKVDDFFDHRFLDHRYRGLYMGRRVTRASADPAALYGPLPGDPVASLHTLYPEELAEHVARWRELEREHDELEALQLGALTAPGGIINFRGRQLRRKELPAAREEVEREREQARQRLCDEDQRIRSTYLAAARRVGQGWPEYLEGLLRLLHYAEHCESNIDDAHATLMNVVDVVLADGRVSDSERRRVIGAASDLQVNLQFVFDARHVVVLPPRVAQRMGVASWAEALPDELGLLAPSDEFLGDWLEAEGGWFSAFSNILAALRHEVLETLLEAEAYMARCAHTGEAAVAAPPAAVVPLNYITFCTGQERDKQKRLDWWDRFVTAEGWGPGVARLAVAGSIVGVVVSVGGAVASPTAIIYNGLDRPVEVQIGDSTELVGRHGHAELEFDLVDGIEVEARTQRGDVIERFEPEIDNPMIDYVYNVAGATPLVEWQAVYGGGSNPPQTNLGAPRWIKTTADHVFEQPPETVTTRSGVATRRVITAVDEGDYGVVEELVSDETERQRLVLAHARWDTPETALNWMDVAVTMPGGLAVLGERVEANPRNVMLGRMAQDYGDKEATCARHRELAAQFPDDADAAYLATRCIDDDGQRRAAFVTGSDKHMSHPHFALSAAWAVLRKGEYKNGISYIEVALAYLKGSLLREQAAKAWARSLRMLEGATVDLSDVARQSPGVAMMVGLESGEAGLGQVYLRLARGDLDGATELPADGLGPHADRVARLVGASDGATEAQIQRALEMPADRGLDLGTAPSALALAARHGKDTAPFEAFLREVLEDEADSLLVFADRAALTDGTPIESRLDGIHIELRGHAMAMACIVLGDEAPKRWRGDATALLFSPERPYFIVVSKPGDEPAEP